MTHADRRTKALRGVEADALLVTSPMNVRYLTGFTGSNGQLLLCADSVFYTDGRYDEQSTQQVPGLERSIYSASLKFHDVLAKDLADRGITRLGVEASHMTVASAERLRKAIDGVDFVHTDGVVERVREIKDAAELSAIAGAQKLAEQALLAALRKGTDGATERDLAMAIEWGMRTSGAEGVSFEVIVASGAHSALPHARPRNEPIEPGVLLIDLGAQLDGYCSDTTRTYLTAQAPEPLTKVHEAVVRALEASCAVVRPGTKCSDVDAAARSSLERDGYADLFVHSTGHGVGLEIHEGPTLTPVSDGVLEPGMVITIEPGVYIPGVGGVRVEDLLVVTDDSYENLTMLARGPDG